MHLISRIPTPSLPPRSKVAEKSHKLSLSADPAKYLVAQHEKALKRDEARAREIKERHEAELQECKFAPTIKDCPAYVKRIAKSMSVMRAARGQEAEVPEKPTWK